MTTISLSTSIHLCEDTTQNFDLRDILIQAGYTNPGALSLSSFLVKLPDGTQTRADTPLFGKVDADTIYVNPGAWAANYNGSFSTVEVVIDNGAGNTVSLRLQVIVDPVNDAPAAADKTFNLSSGAAVTLAEADFGFHDDVEHNNFQSVIITSTPAAGNLYLNGNIVAANTEIAIADIRAGHVTFVPDQTIAGSFDVGFKVRDDGGTVGCGAADTSVAANYLTFKVPMATLGDVVWEDKNGNGVQDAGEAGIAGVTVVLKDTAGNTVATTTTDAAGAYHFTVNPGTYSVSVVAPAGYTATTVHAGTDTAADSDIDANGNSGLVTIAPGETNNTIDAGLYKGAELGDRVWIDSNKNGVQDAGEAGAAGIKVTLLDANGHAVGAATTDANGNYLFTNLAPGSYSVQFDKTSLPAGYVFTTAHVGGDATLDSDASTVDGSTATVVLASGDVNHNVDAGIVATPATIGDRVWEDKNGNGVQDAGESGIAGVTVQLKDASGNLVGTTTTDANGNYHFSVDPGTYSVAVVAPAGYQATLQNAGVDATADSNINASGNSAALTVGAGEVNNTIDAGLYKGASLGDRVWIDCNNNGVQDKGEDGVAGVKVYLLDAAGHVVGSPVVTDANGNYLFTNLAPGSYSVQFDKTTLPAGYVFSTANVGTDITKDSDANATTGITSQVTLASGDVNLTLDAGLVKAPKATIGDKVWEDKNGNGVQDAGESGIACVTVQLKDAAGKVIATTTTDSSGNYSFSVDAGTYSVAVVAPKGYVATTQNVGSNDAVDSDINASGQSDSVTVVSGQNYKDLDAGLVKTASLGDRVWIDCNNNGVQDKGEDGVAGVKVYLLDSAGHVVGSPVVTDANGNYLFTGLKPGTYSVQFDKTTLPAGYVFTTTNVGKDDTVNSDADTATGITHTVTLASGDVNLTLDAGLVKAPKATIGDKVWEDTNGNGIQDAGECGIACVTVQLKDASGKVVATTTTDASGNYSFSVDPGTYSVAVVAPKGYLATTQNVGSNDAVDSDINASGQSDSVTVVSGQNYKDLDAGLVRTASVGDRVWIDCNNNGIQDKGEDGVAGVKVYLLDASGKVVGSPVLTDANGNYVFAGLKPGTYSVQFDKTTLPAGYVFTTANVGKDDSKDSDADVTTGITHTVTLASGDVNTALDAGLVKAPKATIGDKVWEDSNGNGVQDAGECGIAGVTVQLKNAAGTVVSTTTTDASGNYSFSVDAGTYSVAVKAPAGYTVTSRDVGSNDAVDSDVDASGNSAKVTVTAGQVNNTLDAGLYKMAAIGDRVWFDANGNGIQDAKEVGMAGVKVNLIDAGGHIVASATTDANGNYLFSNVVPGTYSVGFVAPAGYLFTKQDQGSSGYTDSDADLSGHTIQTALSSGQSATNWDAGLVKAASIGDKVWEDKNFNGVQDAGESGISGVKVNLLDASGNVIETTTTDKNGNYLFNDLYAGNYKVEVLTPTGYFYTKSGVGADATNSDVSATTGRTDTISVGTGQAVTTVDAGLYRKASIGDKVWEDKDHDGIQDVGESGINGIKVYLYNANNVLVAQTVTHDGGSYNFSNLDPGSYYLKFDKTNVMYNGVNMSSWYWGQKHAGSDTTLDSDVTDDTANHAAHGTPLNVAYTDTTFLESGENDMSWDATITPIVIDLNGDGVHTIARDAYTGSFDLLGTGTAIQSGWISSSDGFLAVDKNGNGKIDDISELFGGATKGSGFAKLADYDSNHDGVVDAKDDHFAELRIWRDANSNGVTDAGELMTMKQAGVTSLTVGYTELPFLDENNNLHLERSSATLASGKSVDMTDVYLNVSAKDAATAGVTLPSMADLLRDDSALDKVLGSTTTAAVTATATTTAAATATATASSAAAIDAAAHCDVADLLRRAHAVAASSVAAAA